MLDATLALFSFSLNTVSPQPCCTATLYQQSFIKGASVPGNWIYLLVKGKISIRLSMTHTELLCESVRKESSLSSKVEYFQKFYCSCSY